MRFAVVAAVACLLTASSAGAQGTLQNALLAETLFKDGQALMKAGKYAEACAKFAASYKLDPAAGTVLNLANCQEKNGKLATAWIAYTEAAALNAKAGNKDREKFARGKADALRPKLNQVRVQVPFPAQGQEVRLDGNVVPQELWNSPMPVDAGEHKLESSAPGRVAWTGKVNVLATTPVEVAVVPGLQPVVVAKPEPKPEPEPVKVVEAQQPKDPVVAPPPMMPVVATEARKMSTGRVAGIVIGGVGVAGVAASIGMLVSAKGMANDRDALCPPGGGACWSQDAFNKDHDARVMQNWGLVAGGVGVAALAAGLALALVNGDVTVDPEEQPGKAPKSKDKSDEFSLNVGPTSNGSGFQIVMGGVW